ncbi:uncharacterized protein TNCV_1086051 [Trichonephila clavipes]|nr:uncharacterized protein TNCV_1086051 [Trichonephila clavipes]
MKIGNNGNLVLVPFDESTPCLMIFLMNCQTKLRINHLTAVKSVAILERRSNANGNILSNWVVSSAIDIIAKDIPTHFNHNTPSTVIDIGFAANFSHSNVFTVNELSSDHNPVIFDFATNCQLPPLLQTLKTTNWIKFQEILHYNMPGNPTVDNLDQAVQNFSNIVSDAINTSTSTRISKTSHLHLPINIRVLIKTKNRFRKLWNNTRYPLYKREVNALIRQIRIEINEHKNRTWKNLLSSLNVENNSLYNLHKRITKKHTVIPPLHGPSGMAYSDFEKAERLLKTLLKSLFKKMLNLIVTTKLKMSKA